MCVYIYIYIYIALPFESSDTSLAIIGAGNR